MPLFLVHKGKTETAVPVDKPLILFGRHAGCDVIITCSRKVSRRHCCLAQINNRLVVRDLGSMNGVRVGGVRVTRDAKLKRGETLVVGDVPFELVEGHYEVVKGKITVGPPLDSLGEAGEEKAAKKPRPKDPNRVRPPAGFHGLKSSRPNRGGGSKVPPPRRPPAADPGSESDLDAFSMDSGGGSDDDIPTPPKPKRGGRPAAPPSSSVVDILAEEDDDAPPSAGGGADEFADLDLDEFDDAPKPPPRRKKRKSAPTAGLSESEELDLGELDEPTPPPRPAVADFEDDPLPVSHSSDSVIELSEQDLLD